MCGCSQYLWPIDVDVDQQCQEFHRPHYGSRRGTWNWPVICVAFEDNVVHPTINLDEFDPECEFQQIVGNEPLEVDKVEYILNNSFGMLGINSALIVKRF